MNIAIDITSLETGHGRRGVGTYTKNIITALKQYENEHSYILFTRKQKVPSNADLVHYPSFDPFFLTLPILRSKPTVVTVHDLIPIVFPDKFPAGIRGSLKWQVQKLALRGSRRIITDSETSKKDIARITGFAKGNIDAIYLAPGEEYKKTSRSSSTVPSVLYVGDVNWNKNVPGLIRAFAFVPKAKLVLIGGAFTNKSLAETREIDGIIKQLGLESRVIRTGYVADRDLISMYSEASCLVIPSFYEGFGLPALEAMACECPVVVANNSSLAEISGPAIKIDPTPQSIVKGISKVLAFSSSQRKELIAQQTAWVKKFTWEKVARQTVEAYERALL